MWTKISKIFFTLLMPVVLLFNSFSFDNGILVAQTMQADIEYSFSNSNSGSAAGTVTITAKLDGEYELYWGDENYKKLEKEVSGYTATYSEFVSVEVENGTGTAEIGSFTYIPAGAETIIAYKDLVRFGTADLPESKQTLDAEPLYSFGTLSDVHFNRYYLSLGDDAKLTFPNALNFLDSLGVSIVAMPGDLSADGEEDALQKFNETVSNYDFPVFTTTGNHDVSDYFTLENWNKYINTGVYEETPVDGVISVGDNNLDFSYSLPGTDDVFIFFNQVAWQYGDPNNSRLVTDEQLDWLEAQLEANKDKTVYLFFHTFTSNPDGNPGTGAGNLISPKNVTYDLVFTPGAPDETRFRGFLEEYTNVVYFAGHSHWAFDMQKYNPELNITDYNGKYATSVHVSSVSSPRRVTDVSDETSEYYMRSSEGYYIAVYEDYMVLYGIDFLRGEFLAYATYTIDTSK